MRLALAFLVLTLPAFAHHGEHHPTGLAQLDPGTREMQRARQNPAATPFVPEQNRTAADADAAGIDDAAGLLNAAHAALRNRRTAQAIEFLERAEARLLTRSTPANRAGVPVEQGPVARIANARRASSAGDVQTALRETDAALVALERPRRRPR